MAKKLTSLFILTLFIISIVAITADAKTRVNDPRTEKLSQYGFMFQKKAVSLKGDEVPVTNKSDVLQSLNAAGDGNAPGIVVSHSYYEWQANSSYGRGIDWRDPNPQIHMGYTQMFAEGG